MENKLLIKLCDDECSECEDKCNSNMKKYNAVFKNENIGFVKVEENKNCDNPYVIRDICVLENFRKKGFGSALIKHFEQVALSLGKNVHAQDILLDEAATFWKKQGFTPTPNCIYSSQHAFKKLI